MNEKRLLLILSFFLFISMLSFAGYAEPQWSNITNVTPANYNSTILSEFNVTWTDDVNMTFIEIVNASNSSHVIVNNSTMDNTYGNDTFNFSIVLPAGSWNWTSYANNSTGNWSSTDMMTIEIGKGEVSLVLENNNSWSAIYLVPTNTTGSNCPSQLNCTLYRDDTNVTNPDITDSLNISSYNYTYNTSGNENYTSNSTSNILVINKIPTSISLWLNGTEGSKSYNLNDTANFTAMINVTGLNISLISNFTELNATYNDTVIYNQTNLTTGGLFYVTVSFDGNDNYSSTSTTRYFDTIPPTYLLTSPNSSEYDFNKTHWFNITVFAANITTVTLEFNNTTRSVSNSSNRFWFSINDLPAGNYTYRWNITNSLGNKTSTGNLSYNITKKSPSVIFSFSAGYSVVYGTSTTVNCSKISGESIVSLYRNGVIKSSGADYAQETITLDEGTWNYTCAMIATDNYTSYNESHDLNVSSGSFVPSGGSGDDTTDTTTSTGQLTLTSSESNLTIDAGTSRVISFTISNTLSSGDVTNVTATVAGISSEWYALDKTTIDRVRKGDSAKIRMTLNVPGNATNDTYQIKFSISGKSFSGSTLTRETTINLTVNEGNRSDVIEESALVTIDQNSTDNDTFSNATGFLNIKSEYVPYVVIALAAALSIIIFFNRGFITENLMKMGGTGPAKEAKKPKKGIKLPSLKKFNYKISINLKKQISGNEPKTLDLKEEKADDLKREIKKDMKELKNIMEAEKKIKKNRK